VKVRAMLVLLALVASSATLFVTAPPAFAGACQHWGCLGLDPNAIGCDTDAVLLDEFTYQGFRIMLFESPDCYAAWTKVQGGDLRSIPFAHIQGSFDQNSIVEDYWISLGDGNYTLMVPFDLWVRACVGADAFGSCESGQYTGWH